MGSEQWWALTKRAMSLEDWPIEGDMYRVIGEGGATLGGCFYALLASVEEGVDWVSRADLGQDGGSDVE